MVGGISAVHPYIGQYVGYMRARSAMRNGAVSQSTYGKPVSGVGMVPGVLAGQQIGAASVGRGASPGTPVEPVSPVRPVSADEAGSIAYTIPFLRKGMDPAELAVRMRIQYMPGIGRDADSDRIRFPGSETDAGSGVKGPREVMEEAECQTCKERKYQDGSDDAGVSYKTPTHISPDQAASAVKGHEMEHVVRERAAAEREDRRVVSQSVTMHTDICPECGRVYVSGGTTRTTTASNPQPEQTDMENRQNNNTR